MATNRPRSLIKRNAGVGLEPGSGQTLDLKLSELTGKDVPVMADSVALVDSEATDASKKATLTNCLKILGETAAGTNATSGLSEVDGVLRVNINGIAGKSEPVAADAVAINDSPDSNKNKKVTLANMALFYGAMAQMVNDLKSSLFVTYAEFDAGTTLAVDTKLTDSLEAKGQLIAVLGIVTELFNGAADSSVVISKAALGATPMASAIVLDKDSVQVVGSVVGAWPVTGADSIQAAEGDVYAYVTTDDSRSTGKIGFVLLWMKTA